MRVDDITNLQALIFVAGILAFAWLLFRVVPSGGHKPQPRTFSPKEIKAYDKELPKYFLAAALALALGGLHAVVKNLPGFWQWLWKAGYGGHLFRDLSNSHIIIVGGGTILLTAFTWYALPRFTSRPLYSNTLAGMSFWLTVVGVFGFYLAWLVLGLVEGNMVAHGWDYTAAKEFIGKGHKIPTAITSSIMGMGYWTYVLNTFLTAFAARHTTHKPKGYLIKFSLVSAGALFIGTVQGVIQVLPKNADWIHLAGKFGQYVDPISHAHVNLVTGMMVSLGAFLVYFGPRMGLRLPAASLKHWGNLLFWVLVPGSLAFYLAFLLLGLVLGGAVNGYGGIQAPQWVPLLSQNLRLILAAAGSFMLAGFWIYFVLIWRGLKLSTLVQQVRDVTPAAFWLLSSLALVVGTFQGLLQVIPATAQFLTVPEEVPNIHAQLNMIGGVLLALIGLVYLLLPELVGEQPERALVRGSLYGVAGGIAGYYLVTLTTGLVRYAYLQQGMDDVQAALRLGWIAPALLVLSALPLMLGFFSFGACVWRATRRFRAEWRQHLLQVPERLNGPMPGWRKNIPTIYILAAEAVSASVGFPGLGWLLSGQGIVGIPLGLTGPAIAWGVIPMLFSPYGNGPLVPLGSNSLLIYLSATTLLSVGALWISQVRQRQVLSEGQSSKA
jgi:hypothetical protein